MSSRLATWPLTRREHTTVARPTPTTSLVSWFEDILLYARAPGIQKKEASCHVTPGLELDISTSHTLFRKSLDYQERSVALR